MGKLYFKIKRENCSESAKIIFSQDNTFNQCLEVYFGGNLDLYFSLIGLEEGNTFLISADNYEVYEIFDNLYKEVLNGCDSEISEEKIKRLKIDSEMYGTDFAEELDRLEKHREKTREENLHMASSRGLIKDDKIIWLSDDYPEDSAPYLIIHKFSNAYELEFGVLTANRRLEAYERHALSDFRDKFMVSVRFNNNGSKYAPFNSCFMHAYNKMLELNPDYDQGDIGKTIVNRESEKRISLEKVSK